MIRWSRGERNTRLVRLSFAARTSAQELSPGPADQTSNAASKTILASHSPAATTPPTRNSRRVKYVAKNARDMWLDRGPSVDPGDHTLKDVSQIGQEIEDPDQHRGTSRFLRRSTGFAWSLIPFHRKLYDAIVIFAKTNRTCSAFPKPNYDSARHLMIRSRPENVPSRPAESSLPHPAARCAGARKMRCKRSIRLYL